MKRLLTALGLLLLMGSCAFHGGMMTANLLPNPESEIVGQGFGRAKTVHVLGIGGLDHQSLMADAKRNLYANRPLKKGETYANLVVNTRIIPWIMVIVTELTVTADIVKLQADSVDTTFHSVFQPPLNENGIRLFSKDDIWVKAGDKVTVYTGNLMEEVVVVEVINDKKVRVSSAFIGLQKYGKRRFFLTDKSIRFQHLDFHVGDAVAIKVEGNETQGIVKGINPYFAMVVSGPKNIVVPIDKLLRINSE